MDTLILVMIVLLALDLTLRLSEKYKIKIIRKNVLRRVHIRPRNVDNVRLRNNRRVDNIDFD